MPAFEGFVAGKTRLTPLPDQFFGQLLPQVDDLDELKLTLYMFWFVRRMRGYPRYMTLAELEAEGVLLAALNEGSADVALARERLHRAVDRAVARGTLLRLQVGADASESTYLLLNAPEGRRAVREVQQGELELETRGRPLPEPQLEAERPNIYRLYEQNIGLLQPLIVDQLRQAEQDYPPEWIEQAFRIAAERNVRHWRYIEAILERWAREGRNEHPERGPA
ncbi:MAG: DnaD domain-containing protein [Anaerolineae bacterium]|jgi:DNA replication protein